MRNLVFACLLNSVGTEKDTLRLASSIRTFGGEFCFNPIWMFSQRGENDLPESIRQELFSLGVRLITFDMDPAANSFPFATYVTAAGIAETLAQGETSFLAFMAADTLVLQAPYEFLLRAGKSLGGCPVHLKLLGSAYNEPVDDFWKLIYHHCGVNPEQVFPMQTIVDEQMVRAYINAGLLVVRPERGLLRAWQANFDALYRLPEFEAFYQKHELYELFMHQVVLAGTFLSLLKEDEFQGFPFMMNYPLHLHAQVRTFRRPINLNQLITCRYEDFDETFKVDHVGDLIQIDAPLKDWLFASIK